MREIKILMLVNILCVSAMMAFLSVVGPIVRALGMAEWQAGATVSVSGVMWVLLSRYWGKKSDEVGRRKVLLLGIVGFSVFYFAMALFIDRVLLSPPAVIVSFFILFSMRGMIGFFYSAIPPVSTALVADMVSKNDRASYMAKLGAASGIGMVVGPIFGGAIAVYGLSIPLYASAILPVFAAIAVFFGISHTVHSKNEAAETLSFFDKRLRLPMAAAFLTMYSVVTSQACLGFYVIDELGLVSAEGAKVTGYILAAVGISFIVAQIAVSKIPSISPKSWLKYGAISAIVGFIIISFMHSQLVLAIGFCIATFGMGFIYPAFGALAANSVSIAEQGRAAGSVSAAQGAGIIIGPLVSTALYGISHITPFLFAALSFSILFIASRKA